jgi:hypothetical protein
MQLSSRYISAESLKSFEELAAEGDIQGILDEVDRFIDDVYAEMPDCDNCDEKMGEPSQNEGYD